MVDRWPSWGLDPRGPSMWPDHYQGGLAARFLKNRRLPGRRQPLRPLPIELLRYGFFDGLARGMLDLYEVVAASHLESSVDVLALDRPRPVSAPRIGPVSTGVDGLGTVGPLLWSGNDPLLLTAGHVFPGPTSLVGDAGAVAIVRRNLFRKNRVVGQATLRSCVQPSTSGGYDYALVADVDDSAVGASVVSDVVGPPHVPANRNVKIFRGRGRTRQGYVSDTALDLVRGRSIGATDWCRCWLVVGRDGVAAQEGDSGASVVLDDGALLGHVVAVLGWPMGAREMCLVQDAWSVLQHARRGLGPDLRFL